MLIDVINQIDDLKTKLMLVSSLHEKLQLSSNNFDT